MLHCLLTQLIVTMDSKNNINTIEEHLKQAQQYLSELKKEQYKSELSLINEQLIELKKIILELKRAII